MKKKKLTDKLIKFLSCHSRIFFVSIIVLALIIAIYQLERFRKKPNVINNISASPITATQKNFDVPILMYHYIRIADLNDQSGIKLSVSPNNFDAQLNRLKQEKFTTIKLEELSDPDHVEISKIYSKNQKPIVLTFDDGYADAYTAALPILLKYHFIGTFFIISDFIGKTNYLSQSQVNKMVELGMEIGSHTLSHPDLTKISLSNARKQILNSKNNYKVFCYPAGKYNYDIINLVQNAGYLAAVTTKEGIANQNSNLFELPRVRVENVSPENLIETIDKLISHEN